MYILNSFKKLNILKISRIDYRNDINGLRALGFRSSFYHAESQYFSWLGVDIFL